MTNKTTTVNMASNEQEQPSPLFSPAYFNVTLDDNSVIRYAPFHALFDLFKKYENFVAASKRCNTIMWMASDEFV